MEGFEAFTGYKTPAIKDLYVTIHRDGIAITLNKLAFEALGSPINPMGIQFHYDQEKNRIGILPVDLRVVRGTPINIQKHGGYSAAGKAFTGTYNIDTRTAKRYKATLQGNMLIVDLNGPWTDATGPRLHYKKREPSPTEAEQFSFEIRSSEQDSEKAPHHETVSYSASNRDTEEEVYKAVRKFMMEGNTLNGVIDIIKKIVSEEGINDQ